MALMEASTARQRTSARTARCGSVRASRKAGSPLALKPNRQPNAMQALALAALETAFGRNGRATVVMPCGTGKTMVGRWQAEAIDAELVVVCVPSLALIPQTLLEYRADGKAWPHRAMVVCSDETTGRAVAVDDLDLPGWAREAVTASTSPKQIGEFLSAPTPGARVLVSTYHSAPRVAAALQREGRRANLLVCDETHRLSGRPREEFRTVLDDGALPAERRLFLTATAVEAAACGLDVDTDESGLLWTDDEATFGPMVYRGTHDQAVAFGLLVDYDVEVLAKGEGQSGGGVVDAILAAIEDGSTRILTFHSRVANAHALAAGLDGRKLPDGRVIRAEHLEASHRAGHRRDVLARLAEPGEGVVGLVASARVLTEGIDVPAVDTVVFADPKQSGVDIVQGVGRCMRSSPGKRRGRIVLPVALPGGELDEDTALASTSWRRTWMVLRALATMDGRFAQTLRGYARRKSPGGRSRTPGAPGLRVELPTNLDRGAWTLRTLERTGQRWWRNLELLRAWAAEHGHARPSFGVKGGGLNLGTWVPRQRTMYRDELLSPEQVAALEELPGWAWTDLDVAWWQAAMCWLGFYAQPRRFRSEASWWKALTATPAYDPEHRVRSGYENLADFLAETCALRRAGELPRHLELAAERLTKWRWDVLPAEEAQLVDALAEYVAAEGDFNVPHEFRFDDGLPLGKWLTALRRRRLTGRLSAPLEYELRLLHKRYPDAVPLRWEAHATAWRLGYLALHKFVAREGTAAVPVGHVEALPDHEVKLYNWCAGQRQKHRAGELTDDQVAALQAIPGWKWELEARRRSRRASVDEADLVDAAKTRGHVRILRGRGVSRAALAQVAGVEPRTVAALEDGTLARIAATEAEALLQVTLESLVARAEPGSRVPAATMWRLVDDMLAHHWPLAWIGREAGLGKRLQERRATVPAVMAQAIGDLHARLDGFWAAPGAREAELPSLKEILRDQAAGARAS